MEPSKRILAFGAAVVIALLAITFFMADNFTATTDAAGGGPEMVLTVKDGGTCEGSACTVDTGADFTLSVEIVAAPAAGYVLAQSFIVYGPDLTYNIAAGAADEIVWPDCNSSVAVRQQLPAVPNSVLHGCLTGLFPPLPVSSYVGNYSDLSMTCSAGTSSTEVELLPYLEARAGTSGALFKLPDESAVTPKVSNLTVNCGAGGSPEPTVEVPTATEEGPTNTPGAETDTPTPTNTSVPPTNTPVPPTNTPSEQLCGDVDGNGVVNSLDALRIQFVVALLTDVLPEPDNADVNGDGMTNAVDAALILQKEAGLISQSALTC